MVAGTKRVEFMKMHEKNNLGKEVGRLEMAVYDFPRTHPKTDAPLLFYTAKISKKDVNKS